MALAASIAAGANPVAVGAADRAAITVIPERFASSDGRCRFAHARLRVGALPREVARRIEQRVDAAMAESTDEPPRPISHAQRLASCRREITTTNQRYDERRTIIVGHDGGGILGLVVTGYDVLIPSAHGSATFEAFAFDLTDGRAYGSADMFEPASRMFVPRRTLRDLIHDDLVRQDRARGTRDATAVADDFSAMAGPLGPHDVSIERDGIAVCNFFLVHALASVCARISAHDLRRSGIVDPSGPLRIFLRP